MTILNHDSAGFEIDGDLLVVLPTITHLLHQMVAYQPVHLIADCPLAGQIEAAHHVFRSKFLRQPAERVKRLLLPAHIH